VNSKQQVLIAISSFNSGVRIVPIIRKLKKLPYNVIIVDDASSDNSCSVISQSIKGNRRYVLIKHKINTGVGSVIRDVISYGIKHKYDVVALMAGNGKDNPLNIPKVLNPIIKNNYDYVQGSRFLIGGSYKNLPIPRKLLIKGYSYIVWLFTGYLGTDVTNGFRAYKLSIFNDKEINIYQNWLDRYQLETYIQFKVMTLKYKLKEVPVSKDYIKGFKKYSYIRPFLDWWQIMSPLFLLKFKIRN